MATDFKLLEFELYGLLLKAKELLASLPGSGPMADKLDEELERIKTKKYNVAVVGEFRRGKSSLINALLGLPVLPADATPTTATVNRITYGAEPSVTIHYKDGSQKKLDSLEELPNYVTKLSAEREAVAKTVREAVVEYPIVICQNHVDIIDTPGLSDDEEMTRVTIGLLQNIDAAIVAVSALAPFAESEKKFVAQLIANPGVTHILFVVTFIDQIDPEEYDRIFEGIKNRIRQMVLAQVKEQYGQEQWILEKAGRILDEPSIFGVSSRKALKAFVGNDRRMLEESRFPPFKQALYAILTARQSVNMAEKAVHALREAAAWEQAQHTEREQTLQQQLGCLEGLPGLGEDYCAGAVKSMDALPIHIDYGKVKEALHTGVIDCEENPYNNILGMRFYEEQSYITRLKYYLDTEGLYMCRNTWNSLNQSHREMLSVAAKEATEWIFNEQHYVINQEAKNSLLREHNMKILEISEEQKSLWEEYSKPLYSAYPHKSFLHKIMEVRNEFRQ